MLLQANKPRVDILHASMYVKAGDRDQMGILTINREGSVGKFAWKNSTYRQKEVPQWQEANNCQLCKYPFIWNVTECWKKRIIGRRQHHCRYCGKAICAECWNPLKRKIPVLGFEEPVNMCLKCHPKGSTVPSSSSVSFDSGRPPTQRTENVGFTGFDDDPLGLGLNSSNTPTEARNSTSEVLSPSGTLTATDEDLLGLAISQTDSPQKSAAASNSAGGSISQNFNSSNQSSGDAPISTSSSKSSLNYGESIFNSFQISHSSAKILDAKISYEKRWILACLDDKSVRIFDISDLL